MATARFEWVVSKRASHQEIRWFHCRYVAEVLAHVIFPMEFGLRPVNKQDRAIVGHSSLITQMGTSALDPFRRVFTVWMGSYDCQSPFNFSLRLMAVSSSFAPKNEGRLGAGSVLRITSHPLNLRVAQTIARELPRVRGAFHAKGRGLMRPKRPECWPTPA